MKKASISKDRFRPILEQIVLEAQKQLNELQVKLSIMEGAGKYAERRLGRYEGRVKQAQVMYDYIINMYNEIIKQGG